ncbi:LruC domain-containing protein [Vibrio sp. SCSIO 43136]|uniref:LruC domain-containing protein n=1 Tax=Vibrio sp. SCSIO 43136 TaxID=2819101 RepID=UPI00207504D1|nr:LruC domain-containing protein [Vibrio sp. SCSIO 43136]USD67858.1 LruC domain-containing protein [Vibrio sp. SCSIO 43136]
MNKYWIGLGLAMTHASVIAAPFDTCPSKAYLFQSKPVQVYGVNLVTGQSSLLQGDAGTSSNINGLGFDEADRYIYGYDTTNKQIVRMGKDFQVETINTSGLPTDHTFYVGDVFDHKYYLYRSGKGLFRIDLAPLDSDPNATVVVERLSTFGSVSLTDMAFNPVNDKLYGVDNNSGALYEFNPSNGAATYVGDTGETGTFGAGYFDVNGYYYLSRNQDGLIYRIDLSSQAIIDSGVVPAVLFASGPSSSQNDGARCANAPVIDEDSTIDFGDAPDSYATLLASNGPRHQIDDLTWLGTTAPDGESDGQIAPNSDDSTGTSDDENGVGFVTAIEPGLDAIVTVHASTSGYLSAWIDWNQDGVFDPTNEKIFDDLLLSQGQNILPFNADINAVAGSTWSRFRFSQQTGLAPTGGATSGEVEDHALTITAANTTVRHFPSESGYVTLSYEDNWPYTADYDMNDVVLRYRVTEVLKDGVVAKTTISGKLAAVGADYHSGFAVRLPNVLASDVNTSLTRLMVNDVQQNHSGLESDMNEASFVIINDVIDHKTNQCSYFRTQASCRNDMSFAFDLHVSFDGDTSSLQAMPYDPFIFATPGYYHGSGIIEKPGRKWEVHLADQAPTEKFDQGNLFQGIGADTSDAQTGRYFKTANNLPWALMIYDDAWMWPTERTDILNAYPKFAEYTQTGGQVNTDWYKAKHAITSQCY